MPDLKTKFDLILDQEHQLARAIAYAAIEPARLSVWDVMIPFVFITGHLKQKEKREHCVRNLLFTKTLALDAALAMARNGASRAAALNGADTETRNVLASATEGIYADTIRKQQMIEIALLADHFHRLLNAKGNAYAAWVKKAYEDKAALIQFLTKLQEAEDQVALAAQQFLGHRADSAMGHRIARCSAKVRRNWVNRIFKMDEKPQPGFDRCDRSCPARPAKGQGIATGGAWINRAAKWISAAALVGTRSVNLRPDCAVVDDHPVKTISVASQGWKLLQVEPALTCNLRCIMCPWRDIRQNSHNSGIMSSATWAAIRRHLSGIAAVDFTGGGEPLLQPHIVDWVLEAHQAGCETGLLTNGMLLTKNKAGALIDAGINWIGISMDGADASTYERIRIGATFDTVCRQIKQLSDLRPAKRPKLMINFVLMPINDHQLDQMVRLAADLGVDQLNIKQCDVIRGKHGREMGLFGPTATRRIRRAETRLVKARRQAKKLGLKSTAFAFTPQEQPICDQDPSMSMFVRHDGVVAPCINQALGGPTTFLGREVTMPTTEYGRLGNTDLWQLWESDMCRSFRKKFSNRKQAYETVYTRRFVEGAAGRENTENAARQAMPSPPRGCRICHYLYNI